MQAATVHRTQATHPLTLKAHIVDIRRSPHMKRRGHDQPQTKRGLHIAHDERLERSYVTQPKIAAILQRSGVPACGSPELQVHIKLITIAQLRARLHIDRIAHRLLGVAHIGAHRDFVLQLPQRLAGIDALGSRLIDRPDTDKGTQVADIVLAQAGDEAQLVEAVHRMAIDIEQDIIYLAGTEKRQLLQVSLRIR